MIKDATANFMHDYAGQGRSRIVSVQGSQASRSDRQKRPSLKNYNERLPAAPRLYTPGALLAENDRQTSEVATPEGGDPRSLIKANVFIIHYGDWQAARSFSGSCPRIATSGHVNPQLPRSRFSPKWRGYIPQADALGLIPQWAAEAENALPADAKNVITRRGLLIRLHPGQ
jgi:hypothetical protein